MKAKLIGAIGAAVLLASSVAAQAADMPVKAPPHFKGMPRSVVAYYNWTGFYAGISGGYGWGKSSWQAPVVDLKPKGGLIGVTLGYNMQVGALVYGLEGDWSWSMMKDSATCGAFTCETKNNWLGTARGRVGYAFDRFLPYITGGAAFGDIKASNSGFGSASSTKVGWTLGGGLEYAFMNNWTVKAEYLYVNLGKFDCGASCGAAPPNEVDFKANIFRVGLNYKFSGPLYSRF